MKLVLLLLPATSCIVTGNVQIISAENSSNFSSHSRIEGGIEVPPRNANSVAVGIRNSANGTNLTLNANYTYDGIAYFFESRQSSQSLCSFPIGNLTEFQEFSLDNAESPARLFWNCPSGKCFADGFNCHDYIISYESLVLICFLAVILALCISWCAVLCIKEYLKMKRDEKKPAKPEATQNADDIEIRFNPKN